MPEVITTTPPTPFTAVSSAVPGLPPKINAPGKVRLVKDTLRAGRWRTGYDANGQPSFHDFTLSDLAKLAQRHAELKASGIPVKLCWDHPPKEFTPFPQADKCIADVADLWVAGDVLYASVYVSPETATKLTDQSWPCSPGIMWNLLDGQNRTWSGPSFLHLAVVSQGVLPAQKPFVAMSLRSQKPKPMTRNKNYTLHERKVLEAAGVLPKSRKPALMAMDAGLQQSLTDKGTNQETSKGFAATIKALTDLFRVIDPEFGDFPQSVNLESLPGGIAAIASQLEKAVKGVESGKDDDPMNPFKIVLRVPSVSYDPLPDPANMGLQSRPSAAQVLRESIQKTNRWHVSDADRAAARKLMGLRGNAKK